MIKMQLFAFILRWLASSIGMFFCLTYLGTITAGPQGWILFALAGLIFSLVNSFVKPLIKLVALPIAIISLGLSSIIINIAMVWLTIYLLPGVEMDLVGYVATSVIMTVINSVLNFLLK